MSELTPYAEKTGSFRVYLSKAKQGYRPIYCDIIRILKRISVWGGGEGGRGWEDEGVKQFFLSVGSLHIF